MRSDPISAWAELVELGRFLDAAGWPTRENALARLHLYLAGERAAPSNKFLRGALTYANQAGDTDLVLKVAAKLGEVRVFEDPYVYGQVALARKAKGLVDPESWESFLSLPLGARP